MRARNVLGNVRYVLSRAASNLTLIFVIWAGLSFVSAAGNTSGDDLGPMVDVFSIVFVPFLWLAIIHCSISTYQGNTPRLRECFEVAFKAYLPASLILLGGVFATSVLGGIFALASFLGVAATMLMLVIFVAERPRAKDWLPRLFKLVEGYFLPTLIGLVAGSLILFLIGVVVILVVSTQGLAAEWSTSFGAMAFLSIYLFFCIGLYIELRNLEVDEATVFD
ncbi:MAG: hypothetical protein AAFX02_08315 [Pseudomonadota bacterium]